MKVCNRILAGLTLLISATLLLLSLAVGIGVWLIKEPVTAKATHVFERIEAALDVADQGLDHVKTSLARATECLDSVRDDQKQLAGEPRKADIARRLLVRIVQQRLAPALGDAHEKLHTVTEAAVVVNSMLEDLGNLPFLSVTGLDVDRLTAMNSNLSRAESSAWELLRLLGEPASEPGSDAAARSSEVERTLQAMRGLIAEYEPRLTQVRQQTEGLKSRTLAWVTRASILISVVCFWIALSQVSLMFHTCAWWKNARLSGPRAIPT
jgi:hypothetical protein